MPKILNIMRHAKSDWGNAGVPDRDRSINKRGQRDAPRMGASLAKFLAPQDIWVSPARRAQLTLEGLISGWPELADKSHYSDESLYTFSSRDLLQWLSKQDDCQHELFILGHNPGMTELINYICGTHALDNLPTAGFVQLVIQDNTWQGLANGCGKIEQLLIPKQLADDL